MLSSTKLRENVYALLDEVLKTGNPLEIERKGHTFLIIPQAPVSKLDRLIPRPTIKGDPEDLAHLDWSDATRQFLGRKARLTIWLFDFRLPFHC